MVFFEAIAFLLALSVPINADGPLEGLVYAPRHASADYYAYPRYAFEYAVRDPHTGDNKAQWEKRDGDVVIGAYSLVEPDGSLRVVEYHADDKSGFNAVVKRIGPHIHPIATPIYKASIPSLGYKSCLPHAIGPVAGLEKLASAPLYNGAYPGRTMSSGLLYKSLSPAMINNVAPISPLGKIIEDKVSAPAPLYNAQIIPKPIYNVPIIPEPIYKGPIIPEPIYKRPIISEPIYKGPIISEPIYKGPIVPESIYKGPIIPEPIYKGPIIIPEPFFKRPILPIYNTPIPQIPVYKTPVVRPAMLPQPILKQAPLLRDPIYSSYLGKNGLFQPGLKNMDPIGYTGIDYNLIKKDLSDYRRLYNLVNNSPPAYKDILEYNAPLIYKGYSGSRWGYGH